MRKSYKLEGKLCPNCASKIERKISSFDDVDSASINVMTLKMSIEADEKQIPDILKRAQGVFDSIEPGVIIKAK